MTPQPPLIGKDGREKCPRHMRYLVGKDNHCPTCFFRPAEWRAMEVSCAHCQFTAGKHLSDPEGGSSKCPGVRMEPKPDYDHLPGTTFTAAGS